jgi:membrane protein YqaA with SNARE-associated domain
MWAEAWVYIGLFTDAFIAATLLPAFSEVALAALIIEEIGNPVLLLLAATSGNVAGSILNWWIGKTSVEKTKLGQRLITRPSFEHAQRIFQRFGNYSLLLAWLPVIGDPLTLVAGVLRTPINRFLILVTIGKAIRYAVIAHIALSVA